MFTQAMPALSRAMQQSTPPGQMANISRALGNCEQPLTHRGPVAFLPPSNLARNNRGVYQGWSPVAGSPNYGNGPWNPSQYPNLIPSAGFPGSFDIAGMNHPAWNSGNSYASNFSFPTDQHFNQNQYFGGPSFYVTNNAQIDNIYNQNFEGDEVTVKNFNTITINGNPTSGQPGPPGASGAQGLPGAPGAPGRGGLDGGRPYGFNTEFIQFLTGRPSAEVVYGSKNVVLQAVTLTIPTGVTFDAENCAVSFSGTQTYVVAATTSIPVQTVREVRITNYRHRTARVVVG